MAQVTYRGVIYNTENRPNQSVQSSAHIEVYRGVMFYVDENGCKFTMTPAEKK